MRYISTRGDQTPRRFCEILLEGLAPDGGLYLPERYPTVDRETLSRWRQLSYAELAFEILSLYIDDIPADDLKALCDKTYTAAVFGTSEIVPVRRLEGDLCIEALSNGPTLAFKDIALQLVGRLFDHVLAARGERVTIVGATSGDTVSKQDAGREQCNARCAECKDVLCRRVRRQRPRRLRALTYNRKTAGKPGARDQSARTGRNVERARTRRRFARSRSIWNVFPANICYVSWPHTDTCPAMDFQRT